MYIIIELKNNICAECTKKIRVYLGKMRYCKKNSLVVRLIHGNGSTKTKGEREEMKLKTLKLSQVAPANFVFHKYSLDYTLDAIERSGAKVMEFYCADPHLSLDDVTIQDIRYVGKRIREHGLRVVDVCPENCTYPVNLASTNLNTRKRTYDYYLKALQAANEWECPNALFFPGWATMDSSQEDAWKRAIDSMTSLAHIAETYGVTIILEAAPSTVTVVTDLAKEIQMIEEVNSQGLSGMADLMCLQSIHETMESAIEKFGMNRLRHIHFNDGIEVSAGHWTQKLLGEGDVPVEHMLQVLDENGYEKYFGWEAFSPYDEDPISALAQTMEWCRERFVNDI